MVKVRNSSNKYTYWSVFVLFAVLVGVLVSVNAAFAVSLRDRTEDLLLLIRDYGSSPEAAIGTDGGAAGRRLTSLTGQNPYLSLKTSSYFQTVAGSDGEVLSVDVSGATQVSQAEAELMTRMASDLGTDRGRVNEYAFLRYSAEQGTQFSFVNAAYPVMQQIRLATASVAVGCIGGGLLLAYVGVCAAKVVVPLQRRCRNGAQLMQACADCLRLDDSQEAQGQTEAMLEAGSQALSANGRAALFSLTELYVQTVGRCLPEADGKGVRIEAAMQPNVFIHAGLAVMGALLEMLLGYAVTGAPTGGTVHANLLADGKTAAVLVQYMPQADIPDAGVILPAVQMLAAECGGEAAFQSVDDESVCYTVRFPQKHLQGMPAA